MAIPGFTVEEQGDQLNCESEVAARATPIAGPSKPPSTEAMDRSKSKLGKLMLKETAVAKVVKMAAKIADLITNEDRVENLRAIRDAKKARTRLFNTDTKKWEMIPDSRTQLAAVTLQLAYDEGLPVQRSVSITGSFQDAGELITTLSESPAAIEALKILSTLGIKVEAGGEIIDLEQPSEIEVVTDNNGE